MSLALLGAVSQGILWGIMVLGVFITYKMLDIADLTVDGSFALGGCVAAVASVSLGLDPVASVLLGTMAGIVAGLVTGCLHTLFDIPAILAGILTQIALWSINLRVMGKSNTPLLNVDTVFTRVAGILGVSQPVATMLVGLAIAAVVIALMYWFFGTEIGSAMRATGNNEDMCRALGIDVRVTKLIALAISNGLVGLSGALICQSQKYADIGMGTGAIVIGLAAIVIGEVLGRLVPGGIHAFGSRLTSAVVGSVVYFLIRAIVLQLGLDPNDMKLLSAAIVAIALVVPVMVERGQLRRSYSKGGEL
ncbi:ABC transporter permease [Olsenella urininfantis]|uniref:ABC transporter permease n=1 Tax=Olsenella urininfantis TaxID=1871033 RepID=UPI000984E5A9|nr:ABC transporter permease [Olsenella urininfantis]